MDWTPLSKDELIELIKAGETRMNSVQLSFWNTIKIEPEKWIQHPNGDQGNGFWAVGLIGNTVIWYNDIEEGFNCSKYTISGTIDDYWCNQDELEITIGSILRHLNIEPVKNAF